MGDGSGCCCRGCRGLGAGHLRGCWMCCVLGETCLSMDACGFWWATCAAAGGKSLSPRAITPEMNTVGLGGLVLSHSCSSLSFSSFPSPVCGCFCTIRIPPAFTLKYEEYQCEQNIGHVTKWLLYGLYVIWTEHGSLKPCLVILLLQTTVVWTW